MSTCRALVVVPPPCQAPAPSLGVVVVPHPLTLQGRQHWQAVPLLPGETLASVLQRHGVQADAQGWVVTVNGAQVPQAMWPRVRPRTGTLIEAHRVAGKSALRVVALIAVAYFTLGTGLAAGGIGGYLGASGFAAMAINVGAAMLGSMLVNRVLGPKMPRIGSYDQQTASTYALSGGRNRMRHYEPLGLVLGIVKVVPDYVAQPYTWFDGDDQYLYCRFHAGINCGSVAQVQIGATAITAYQEVTVSQAGFPGSSSQLQDWSSVDTVAGGALDAVTAPGAYVTRTSSSGSVRLVIDLSLQLYNMADDGSFTEAVCSFEAERRLLPSGPWVAFDGASAAFTLRSTSTKPLRRTISSPALTAGQYEVRLRKTTANVSDARRSNLVEWGALKSYQNDTTNYASHPQVGIRIRATGQLNGSLDEVNWVATGAATPVWNGSAWITTATSNPGALILQLARGIYDSTGRLMAGLGWADAQIDIAGLQAFMIHCAGQEYRFDHYVDQPTSCIELLEAIAAAGLGSIDFHSGSLTVVWLSNTRPIEAVVSMANIKQGSFRVDYTTRELAQEIEAAWRDRDDGWLAKSMRAKAPGVSVPRDTARIEPLGATTNTAVARALRLAMAQNLYQRKAVSWEMDLEHVTFRRFMLLSLSHDMTQWGYSGQLRSAVVVSGSTVQLTLDEPVPYNAAAGLRAIGLRLAGESQVRVFNVAAFSGESRVLTLTTAWPGGVPVPGSTADNPADDTLWIYDFKAVPGQRLCVVQIEPTGDMSGARITAVPEPDEFWAYMASGAYEVPALGSSLALVASNIGVTQDRLNLTYDGSTQLAVTFDVVGTFARAELWMGLTGQELKFAGETTSRRFDEVQVVVTGTYNIEVRPFDGLGRRGSVATRTYTVALVRVSDRATFAAALAWVFTGGSELWNGGGTGTLSYGPTTLLLQSSGTDPQMIGPVISQAGASAPVVRARVMRLAGSGWQGSLYYQTSGHGFSDSYRKDIPDTTVLNQWVIVEWDMSFLDFGYTDWVNSVITRLRIDLGNTAADRFEIDWVAMGSSTPASYGAVWGGNVYGQPGDPELLNSYQVIGQNLLSESDQPVGVRFALRWNPNNAVMKNVQGQVITAPVFSDTAGSAGWNTTNYVLSGGRTRGVYIYEQGRVSAAIGDTSTDGAGNLRCADFEVLSDCPVAELQRYISSVYVRTHRCSYSVWLLFFNAAGGVVATFGSGVVVASGNFSNTLSAMTRSWAAGAAPAGAAFARLVVTKWTTYNLQSDSYMWLAAPQVEAAAPNQAGPSPYNPGPVGAIGTDQLLAWTSQEVVDYVDAAGVTYSSAI